MKTYLQTPAEVLDYGVAWTPYLPRQIQASEWIVGDGLEAQAPAFDDITSKVHLAVTTAGIGATVYVTNRITDVLGLKHERAFKVRIVERKYK